MNNTEKASAKILKQHGFHVFWAYQGEKKGDWWATHPKLIAQYHVHTCSDKAIKDLELIK